MVLADVSGDVAQPADHALAAGLEGALEGLGVEWEEVSGRQGGGEEPCGEPSPLLGPPIELGVGDHLLDRALPGQVSLGQPTEPRVVPPGPVGEPPVTAFGLDVGPSGEDLGELQSEAGEASRGVGRTGGHVGQGPDESQAVDAGEDLTAGQRLDDLGRQHLGHRHHLKIALTAPTDAVSPD